MSPAEQPQGQEDPADDSYIVVLVARGGARLGPGERLQLNQLQTDAGLATVFLMTRFQEVGLPERLPQELIFEVHCPGTNLDDAVGRAANLATSLTPLISFAVNAFVDLPMATIAFEGSPGRTSRRYWQAKVDLGAELLAPRRPLQSDLLFALIRDVYTNPESKRLARAISQYHAALRNWTTAGQPLALVHLYPALEALSPATERAERQRLGLIDEQAHAIHRSVDVSRSNWREVLLGYVRRDVICQGDDTTYRTAYKASNGLEHGSMDMPLIRTASLEVTPKLFGYVRRGILDLLSIDTDVRERLAGMRIVDVTPFHHSILGVLTGDVAEPAKLGPEGEPYPWMDWETTVEDVTVRPDGRNRLQPSYTFTARIAPGVLFTARGSRVAVGLNDPAEFVDPGPQGAPVEDP